MCSVKEAGCLAYLRRGKKGGEKRLCRSIVFDQPPFVVHSAYFIPFITEWIREERGRGKEEFRDVIPSHRANPAHSCSGTPSWLADVFLP